MKHLYIIGNGFDIHTGLATRYADFQLWLENNYPFIYENMQAVYDIDAEWWNDFEVQLGNLDINKFVSKFTPPAKPVDEIIAEAKRKKEFEERYNIPPSLHFDSYCAKRLKGLLDVLQFCFEKWVDNCQRLITDPKYIHIEKEDSFFINFNYTDVLEMLYKIPEERVLHIHGRSSKHERLIYGHNKFLLGSSTSDDKEQVSFELNKYHKNPYELIFKHQELQKILKDVEYVHIYGFSFSAVDEDYMDWFFNNVSATSQWEVSWFSNEDKNRIDKFILDHWNLKDRLKTIKLEEISQTGKP
ncbi:AbiH family protein [uncultured Prevotella sp.]|uniref:AbiH family protein n=1 Tax=uncultured Prevotella sp. TaxID=159272 RepID=UPI00260692E5|nr:AbiH family protein [uncultured Prevotella sp.]